MRKSIFKVTVMLCLLPLVVGCGSQKREQDVLDHFQASLVEVELSRKKYNYRMPWITGRQQTRKNGVVLSGKRILTTADDGSDSVLVRVQKDGESRKYEAEFVWIDYYANLAVLKVDDDDFWSGLAPVKLAPSVPQSGNLHILRWKGGRLEAREAEIERLFVGKSQTSYVEYLQLEVTSEINAAGWSEVVVQGDQVVGLTASANGKSLKILPSPVIRQVLGAREGKDDHGLGYFDFIWQPGTNPALLRSLGLNAVDNGIVVTRVGLKRVASGVLKPGDVILKIDGFDVDVEGKYLDPEYGRLSFERLATRSVVAGQNLSMVIWRDGEERKIDYPLPQADFARDLVPDAEFDKVPEYLIAGGFVFQPLTGPLLASFGKNVPFLMQYYDYQRPVKDRDGLVVLSGVMPDPYNRGYEDARHLIVDTINGQPVSSLKGVSDALEHPKDGYHILKFFKDQPLQTLVLDADTMRLATARVLKRYRVERDRNINLEDGTKDKDKPESGE